MDLKLLREATRPEHEATEAAVPLTGSELSREQYVAVLQRFHTLICAWDGFARTAAPEPWKQLVHDRQRCDSLRQDLAFFQAAPGNGASAAIQGEMRQMAEAADTEESRSARFLGMMYVIEGSTLGGQYIAKQVEETLGLQKGEGDRYFRGYGEQTMPRWREFQQVLQQVPDQLAETVIASAKAMFHLVGGILRES